MDEGVAGWPREDGVLVMVDWNLTIDALINWQKPSDIDCVVKAGSENKKMMISIQGKEKGCKKVTALVDSPMSQEKLYRMLGNMCYKTRNGGAIAI